MRAVRRSGILVAPPRRIGLPGVAGRGGMVLSRLICAGATLYQNLVFPS